MSRMLKSRNYVMWNSMGPLSPKMLRDWILSIQRLDKSGGSGPHRPRALSAGTAASAPARSHPAAAVTHDCRALETWLV